MQQKVRKLNFGGHRSNRRIRNICVYCGSGVGTNPAYAAAARQLGQIMAKERVGLVYGGGGLVAGCGGEDGGQHLRGASDGGEAHVHVGTDEGLLVHMA